MDDYSGSALNTPMKKIRNLTIHSPMLTSPIRYPSMSDFPIDCDPINESMVEKGYSQTLSNAVLRELDTRAQEISSNVTVGSSTSKPMLVNRKRYSGIHKPLFSKMDSITSHYAAARQSDPTTQDISSSATKKRRTLNGPEDIFLASQEDPSPTRRKTHIKAGAPNGDAIANPSRPNPRNLSNDVFSARLQPLKLNVPLAASNPSKSALVSPTISSTRLLSSPIKTPGISPSKGSMNLHGLLLNDTIFAKPEGPVRIRQLSLQMAGVKPPEGGIPSLSRKTSSSELQRTRFGFDLQKKPSVDGLNRHYSVNGLQASSSVNSLQKKPSAGNLQKKPSIPSLQKKPFIPSLQKKPSIPSLDKKTSVSNLQKKKSIPSFKNTPKDSYVPSQICSGTFSSLLKGQKLPSHSNLAPDRLRDTSMLCESSSRPSSRNFMTSSGHATPSSSQFQSRGTKSNVTIPKPFSLYSKPTISSSQKTFGSQNSLNSAMSNASLLASQRSSNRFQKFKSRFS
ncbi:hypothetical protein METBIDRAFT_32994 [Metschnikowia bicuspidata var. bicuspidata NRRL YB-4993]|uniref:Uncharacterized protein n=1 Tax=Metschnikowia bicuspidata var. bicuspidata NRRL YB-4993 TaxID=869754 RepID=A0A1A0H7J3_9ASCO|nr:hypothetical protein METBIDRAFT_32994 [Metschnikowia bicuspidata var. bicuspidata NRRL YB-4993]OBA19996.1 hypothetical protein METBIDRAFT_32994 [Metschnikowia bicuspidata var. bicuspidata NRRL YB-4993]